jgi:hypothetical protein
MAYGSSNEGGYGADMPVTCREQSNHSGGADSAFGGSVLGSVHGADGEVNITRPGGASTSMRRSPAALFSLMVASPILNNIRM